MSLSPLSIQRDATRFGKCARMQHLYLCSLFLMGAQLLPFTAQAAEPEKEQITLKGTVVDEQDKPVADVKVIVEWLYPKKGQIETRTNRQGQFTLRAPVQNERVYFVQAVGNSAHLMAQQLLSWEKLTDDPALKQLRLKLQPARRVELLVVDATGKPIANATAGVLADYRDWGTGLTDDQGRIVFHLPRDVEFQKAFAISDGHGADYKIFSVPRSMTGDRLHRPPAWPDHPVQLKLEGARSLKVLLTETDGTPIPGVKVYPWYIQKPNYPDLDLSGFNSLVAETTDANGAVVFQWIPHWHQKQLTIWPSDQQHVHQRSVYDPKTGNDTLTIQLEKLVPISGRITLPDGSPARGIEVTVSGENYRSDDFRKSVFTDEEGRYTIQAAPNMIYLVTAGNREWASAPQTGFALWPGKPINNLDFQLRPATRIHGRVTVGSQQEPLAGLSFYFYQLGQNLKDTQGITLPNPKNSRKRVQPRIAHRILTDVDGSFEISVGDGNYLVNGLSWIVSQNAETVTEFDIEGEPEKELNFHALRHWEGALTGTVVTGDPPQPVPDAKVIGLYGRNTTVGQLISTTDKSGRFKVNRELYRTMLFAHSKDKKWSGVVEIGPDTKTVTIPLRPSGKVVGQLVDAKTKQPLKEVEIRYGVMLYLGQDDDSQLSINFRQSTVTDQTGHFQIDNLIQEQKYRLTVVFHPEPGTSSSQILETVRVEDDESVDLGVLEMEPPRTQGRLTLEDQITAAFKEPGTPGERFTRQKQEARIAMQHNLVLFGDPRGETVRQLMRLRYRDGKIRRELYSFLMMSVDTSAENRPAAQQLAKTLDANLAGDHADFLLIITDEQGKPLAHADRSALSRNGKITREQVLTFLQTHTVPILSLIHI